MAVVEVRRGRRSCRVYVCGLRIHHGLTGVGLLVAGLATGSRRVFTAGAVMVAHDWADRPFGMLD